MAPAFWQRQVAVVLAAGGDYGRSTLGARPPDQCRVLLGQSDRPAPCRPRPRHGVRRRAGRDPGPCRLRGDPRVLRQRRRRARSRRSPARCTCATARRSARPSATIPAGPLSRRLSDSGRRRRSPRATATAGATAPRPSGCPPFERIGVAAMMALIRDDLAALGVQSRRLHLGARADRGRPDRRGAGRSWTAWGCSTPAPCRRPRAASPTRTGSRCRSCCSARPPTATRSTGRSSARTAPGPISPPTSPIIWTSSGAASPLMVDVWGADHGGYVKRMQAAVRALTQGEGTLDVRLCQLVNLLDGGKPMKMSKRAGRIVTLRDVVDEVGRDVVRFIMLTRKNDAPLDFDFAKVTEQSKDNPVFYVQYAHARICSVLRNAARGRDGEPRTAPTEVDLGLLRRSGRARAAARDGVVPARARGCGPAVRAAPGRLLPVRPGQRLPRAVDARQGGHRACASCWRTMPALTRARLAMLRGGAQRAGHRPRPDGRAAGRGDALIGAAGARDGVAAGAGCQGGRGALSGAAGRAAAGSSCCSGCRVRRVRRRGRLCLSATACRASAASRR